MLYITINILWTDVHIQDVVRMSYTYIELEILRIFIELTLRSVKR